jgi:hypothetical protein
MYCEQKYTPKPAQQTKRRQKRYAGKLTSNRIERHQKTPKYKGLFFGHGKTHLGQKGANEKISRQHFVSGKRPN